LSDAANAHRLLILAPTGRDAELMCTHLEAAGIACDVFRDMPSLCQAMADGAGALLFTEEALAHDAMSILAAALAEQPAWSQVPIIILTAVLAIESKPRSFRELGKYTNVTLVDRPVRIQSLVSAARAALAARQRQYDARDLMRKLEDRVHERDRFLAILGHELRNPLGAILLASQMTGEDGRLDGEHARLIERQSRHLTRIVNDLLDLSRVMSGKIAIKPQLVDLRAVTRQSLQTLEASAQMHGLSIELRLPDKPVPVNVDPVRADQIITNVLTNAIKYTPAGGHVVVALECDDDRARIRVKDDGVGIAADRIGRIFELFAQAENAIGRAQGGMGIGLALVRNLVELHGGTVTARSDGVGKGTELVIELPCATHEIPAEPRPRTMPATPAPPRKIVIVEDNVDIRDLLRLKLNRLGHAVRAVGDGVSGVRAILDSRPHMALIDIGLPRLDGYQVASAVRSKLGRDIVLVAVSGFGQPDDKKKALEAGFDDHITKPADVQDIENLLARFPMEE
jgi:signal transduction histidine kinase/ActR/RegA family two-component response regulator